MLKLNLPDCNLNTCLLLSRLHGHSRFPSALQQPLAAPCSAACRPPQKAGEKVFCWHRSCTTLQKKRRGKRDLAFKCYTRVSSAGGMGWSGRVKALVVAGRFGWPRMVAGSGEDLGMHGECSSQGNKILKRKQHQNMGAGDLFSFLSQRFLVEEIFLLCHYKKRLQELSPSAEPFPAPRWDFFPSPSIHHLQHTAAIYQCQFNSLTRSKRNSYRCVYSSFLREASEHLSLRPPTLPRATFPATGKGSSSPAAALRTRRHGAHRGPPLLPQSSTPLVVPVLGCSPSLSRAACRDEYA